MNARIQQPKPLLPGFGLGDDPTPFGDPSQGLGTVEGRHQLMFGTRPAPNVESDAPDDVSAAAASRRAALARALMEQAEKSPEGAGKVGAWGALPGIAEAIAAFMGER